MSIALANQIYFRKILYIHYLLDNEYNQKYNQKYNQNIIKNISKYNQKYSIRNIKVFIEYSL